MGELTDYMHGLAGENTGFLKSMYGFINDPVTHRAIKDVKDQTGEDIPLPYTNPEIRMAYDTSVLGNNALMDATQIFYDSVGLLGNLAGSIDDYQSENLNSIQLYLRGITSQATNDFALQGAMNANAEYQYLNNILKRTSYKEVLLTETQFLSL